MSEINKSGKTIFKGEAMLLIASVIWGSSFVFQKMGMDFIGPMTFTFFRFGIGTLCMIPVIAFADRMKSRRICRETGDVANGRVGQSAGVMPFSKIRPISLILYPPKRRGIGTLGPSRKIST